MSLNWNDYLQQLANAKPHFSSKSFLNKKKHFEKLNSFLKNKDSKHVLIIEKGVSNKDLILKEIEKKKKEMEFLKSMIPEAKAYIK